MPNSSGASLCCACLKPEERLRRFDSKYHCINYPASACHRQGFEEVDALEQAREEQLLDGRLWRLRLRSPGAESLLLLFRWGTGVLAWESLARVRVLVLHGMSVQLRPDAPWSAILLDALFDDTWSVQQSTPTESCVVFDVDVVTLFLQGMAMLQKTPCCVSWVSCVRSTGLSCGLLWLPASARPACTPARKRMNEKVLICCTSCSEVRLPAGAELHAYAPSATANFTRCWHACARVRAADVPPSGKVTLPLIDGPPGSGVKVLCRTVSAERGCLPANKHATLSAGVQAQAYALLPPLHSKET